MEAMDLNSQDVFLDVYRNKRVLVTGHTGFKGSWLTLWLKHAGAHVVGYALDPPTDPSLFELLGLGNEIVDLRGDVRDAASLTNAIRIHEPEIIFHVAAQPLVRYSYSAPTETFETNVMGTVNVLEAARSAKSVRVCVNVTSDKCYENREWIFGYREFDPMGGHDPYSASKGCAELVASSFMRSFFGPDSLAPNRKGLVSVRAGNVIGGGDWGMDRLIPDCIRALSINQPVILRNPHAIRPWQHVLEPLSGYLWLGALLWHDPFGYDYAWNFGPEDEGEVAVKDVVETVVQRWGSGTWNGQDAGPAHLHEAKYLRLDITKAKCLLGWRPVYSVQEALAETIEWYKAFYFQPEFDATSVTLRQIQTYTRKAQEKRLRWASGERATHNK